MQEKDITILRELAKRVAEISDLPIMKERKEIWKRHHGLERVKPMLLVFPENSWHELIPSSVMQCDDQFARGIEWNLRTRLYYYDKIHDDTVIEKTYIVTKSIWNNGWGLESRFVPSSQNSGAGKYYKLSMVNIKRQFTTRINAGVLLPKVYRKILTRLNGIITNYTSLL